MKKFLLLLVSILGLSSLASAQEEVTTIPGRVVLSTEDLKLVELPNHRQAVYYTLEDGHIMQLGQVAKIRAGTEFYHWGNGTPEQAAAWDKAGQISPELLNRLKADNNFGALGGGFYASLSPVDSISYGNVQIVLRIPRTMKILSNVGAYGISGEQWAKVIPQLDRLGISALQNGSMATWFNIIDANVLTKEHVAKAQDWKGKLERNGNQTPEILEKFPELVTTPSTKIEIKRYLYHWKALASSDQGRIYAAFRYFMSIKDVEGIDFGLARVSSAYKAPALQELMKAYQAMTPDEKANLLVSQNLRSGALFQDMFNIAVREKTPAVRRAVLQLLTGKTDAQAMSIIKASLQDSDSNLRQYAYLALAGRYDSEALELLRQGMNDPDKQVRNIVIGVIGQSRSQEAVPLLFKAIVDSDPNVRLNVVSAVYYRKDHAALEILKIAVRDTDESVRATAVYAAAARPGMKSLDIIRVIMKGDNAYHKAVVLSLLHHREDNESLKIIMSALKDNDSSVKAAALKALGQRRGNFIDTFEKALKSTDPEVQAAAVSALTEKTDKKSLDLIYKSATSQNVSVRSSAIMALTGRSDKNSVQILKNALNDSDESIRQNAVNAARNFQGQDLVDVVKIAIVDTNEWVRYAALNLLQERKDVFAFEILKTSSRDASDTVRYSAVEMLSKLGTDAAIEHLKLLAETAEEDTKGWAIDALRELGHSEAAKAVEAKSVSQPEQYVRTLGQLKQNVQEAITAPRCESVFRN